MGSTNQSIEEEGIQIKQEEKDVLKVKAKEVLDEKRDIIKKFMEKRYENMEESEPNNEEGVYKDKPIIYKIYPKENKYNLLIEIFNFPALLRKENGLFIIVNKIAIIFKYFSDKMKNISKDEYERKFPIFFKSILDCDVNKFRELIGINIQEKDLNILKLGLEKIIRYFGIENIEKYLNKLSVGVGVFGSLVSFIPIYLASSLLSASAIGLGIGIIIGLVGYFILRKFNDNDRKTFENNKKILEKFFDEIKTFSFDKFNCCNIFVIVIDKNGAQIKDISLFPDIMGNLNPYEFPKIGGIDNGESNIKYYECLLKGIQYYIEYYQKKLGSETTFNNYIEIEFKRDINDLIKSDENTIIKKMKQKVKEMCGRCNYNTNNNYSFHFTQINSMESLDNFGLKTSSNINTETMSLKSKRNTIQNLKQLAYCGN